MMISRNESAFSKRNRRAVIIGGSMSGLFSAAFLRQIGWDVDVYERSKVELVGRGAGITGHPELFDALQASGAGTERLGIEVPKRIAIDREGRITDERPLRQILTSWDRLQRLLPPPSIRRITTSAGISNGSSRMAVACVCISPGAAPNKPIS
jgi:hypothetical protein